MRLFTWRTLPVVLAGLACFAGSAWSVFTHRYALSRLVAAGEIALVLVGWGLAQYPYLVYPDMLVTEMAAPTPTLRFMVLSIPAGALLLAPSLWLLMRVFKARPVEAVKET